MEQIKLECTIKVGQRYEDWYGRYFRVYGLEVASDLWSSTVHIIYTNSEGTDVPRKEPHQLEARQVAGMCKLRSTT